MSDWIRARLAFGIIGLLALVTLWRPVLVAADDSAASIDGIYSGTIGRQQIVVEISEARGSEQGTNYDAPDDSRTYPIQGSYFYRRHAVSISLAGMPLKDGSVRFREYRHPYFVGYEFTAEWRVRFNHDRATGVFCKCDLSGSAKPARPVLKITLRRISKKLTPADSWEGYKPNTDYTYYDLLLDSPVKTGPEVEVNRSVAYRMRTDPRLRVSRPELTRFPHAEIMAKINRSLDAELTRRRLWAAAVLAGGEFNGRHGGFYGETVKVDVFLPDVLALLVLFDYYSGGAHPNEGQYALNYNLHTGESFTPVDSFQVEDEWDPEGEVARVLARLYRDHYVKPPDPMEGMDCDDVLHENRGAGVKDAFSPSNATLFMSKKGLVIIPVFPTRWEEPCALLTTVPYRELRPYVKKDSMLGRVVDRAGQ